MLNETLGKDIIDLVMSQNLTMSMSSQIKNSKNKFTVKTLLTCTCH